MDEFSKKAGQILDMVKDAKQILIISHRNPDPDTTGCNLSLRYFFEKQKINADSACIDQLPQNYKYFPLDFNFLDSFDPKKYDLFISVDCGSLDQISFNEHHKAILKQKLINIDHHPYNKIPGTINLVDHKAASASILVYNLLKEWQANIGSEMATWLLFGIYFDTGSFMHSNTNNEVYQIAAELLQKGADQRMITKILFRNHSIEKLRLWGKALNNLKKNSKDTIVTGLTPQDFIDCDATKDDTSGLIDYLGSIENSTFAAFLCSDPHHDQVRGSLRTKHDNVDVSEIAKRLGGGGHKKASGFAVEGKLKREMHWTITNE